MTEYDLAYAGQFLKTYRPPLVSTNSIINSLTTRVAKIEPSALITMEVQFPDVSFYQKEVDYGIMRQHTPAIIIRAGQNIWVDEQFERNYAEAKRAGLLVGVYWFYDDRRSPREQGELLISLLRNKTLEMEVFIDWENSYGGQYKGLQNVVAMMQLVENANLKIKDVGLYSGYYWFRSNSNSITNASQYNYLKNKPLWLAWYTSNPANVLIPAPWTSLRHWQFGTPAVSWGQQTAEIDMNFFNGNRQQFISLYRGETMPHYLLKPSIAGEYRSIRRETAYPSVPHIQGSKIGTINANSSAKAAPDSYYVYPTNVTVNGVVMARTGDVWWKVYEANGVPFDGWVAEKHLGITYLTKEYVDDTPPPTGHVVEVYVDGALEFRKELP